MKPQKNSTKRTVIAFGFALATSLMTLYIQNTNKVFAQHSEGLEASASTVEDFSVTTID